MSVQVQDLTKIYGEQRALDSISFDIDPGEIVAFLGPNGAGKSTTMKILAGYIPYSAGSASVCGLDVINDSIDVRKKIGYLPEHNPLYLDMYVREYLNFLAGVHQLSNKSQRIEEVIGMTGLGLESKKKIGALSKGYRQRVGLAQSILHDPEVLILDEPTTGLDPNQIVDIRELIKELGREKTVMLSTHIMQEVEAICDRVIIIDHGKIVADDNTAHIQKQGANEIVFVEFADAVNFDSLNDLDGVLEVRKVDDTSCLVVSPDGKDIRAAINKYSANQDWSLLTIRKETRSIEDVFRDLTGNKS